MQVQLSLRRLVIILLVVLTILAIASSAVQVGKYVYDYREDWTRMINMDREMNLPTWYEAALLAGSAFLLGLIATRKQELADRFSQDWRLLSRIFYFLAFDEVAGIHELFIIPDLADRLNLPWFLHSTWVIPGSIAVGLFVRRFWRFARHLDRHSRRWFIGSLSCFVFGIIGMEMVGSTYAQWQHQQSLGYAMLATLEEVIEVLGMIAFIYSLLNYLRRLQGYINIEIKLLP